MRGGFCHDMTIEYTGWTEQKWIIVQSVKAPRLLTWRQGKGSYSLITCGCYLEILFLHKKRKEEYVQRSHVWKKLFSAERQIKWSPINIGCAKISSAVYYDPVVRETAAASDAYAASSIPASIFWRMDFHHRYKRKNFGMLASAANLVHPTCYYPSSSQM